MTFGHLLWKLIKMTNGIKNQGTTQVVNNLQRWSPNNSAPPYTCMQLLPSGQRSMSSLLEPDLGLSLLCPVDCREVTFWVSEHRHSSFWIPVAMLWGNWCSLMERPIKGLQQTAPNELPCDCQHQAGAILEVDLPPPAPASVRSTWLVSWGAEMNCPIEPCANAKSQANKWLLF